MAIVKYKTDYFLKDYATIREEMIERLPIISEGKLTDLNESSISVTLVEVFAAIADMLGFYLDSNALEAFLPTVRQPENVYRLVELIGYRIREVTSAQARVQFTLGQALSEEVFIPQGTEIGTVVSGGLANSTVFRTIEKTTIPIGDTQSELVRAIQGVPAIEYFVGEGTSGQYSELSQTSIDISTIVVRSGDVLWEQQDSFLYSESEDRHYVVKVDYLGIVRVYYGDGKYGQVPRVGEQLTIEYLISSGAAGNVGANSLRVISSNIKTVDTNTIISNISVNNPDAAAGGSSKQSLEQVKTNAPGSLSALYRPLTKYDYNALIARLGGIAHVNVWGEQEENPPSYENMNWANICLVPTGGGLPSQNLMEQVKNYLLEYQPITVRVRFIDPEYIYINVPIDIYVLPGYSQSDERIWVVDEVRTFFELGNVRFGQDLRTSTFYKIAMTSDRISYAFVGDLGTYDTDSGIVTPVGQEIILQKWQIPVLYNATVRTFEASELPIPDLYPDEDVDNVIWDTDG
jgi:hypothetical protein